MPSMPPAPARGASARESTRSRQGCCCKPCADVTVPAEQRRDAQWRFARHNNEWWYYRLRVGGCTIATAIGMSLPEDRFEPLPATGQPTEHSVGYRGIDGVCRPAGRKLVTMVRTTLEPSKSARIVGTAIFARMAGRCISITRTPSCSLVLTT